MASLTPVQRLKATTLVRLFGLKSVPLIALVRPKVIEISAEQTEIVIPLNYLTRNHLGSMYFGTLAIGADLSVGLYPALAFEKARKEGKSVSYAFKSMKMSFLKRPDGDAHFTVKGSKLLEAFIEKVMTSDERHEIPLPGVVTVPKKYGGEPVAEFELILSAKKKNKGQV